MSTKRFTSDVKQSTKFPIHRKKNRYIQRNWISKMLQTNAAGE